MTTLEFPSPKVAALFVEYDGVYFNRPDVIPAGYAIGNDQDGTTRVIKDAKSYDGPWPIVAHPPCNSWGKFAITLRLKHGHKIGNDGGCFESALKSVRRWGGVIEHPEASYAWKIYGLATPRVHYMTPRDRYGGLSLAVNQSHYGHGSQKPTWLYVCGFQGDFEEEFYQHIPQGKAKSGTVKYRIGSGRGNTEVQNRIPLPSHLRKRTPELFADLLVAIAKRCTFYRDHWSHHIPGRETP